MPTLRAALLALDRVPIRSASSFVRLPMLSCGACALHCPRYRTSLTHGPGVQAHQWKPLQPELAWQSRKVPTICTLHALFAKCGLGPIAIRQSPVRRRRPPPPPSFFRISLIPDRLFQVPDASIEACRACAFVCTAFLCSNTRGQALL
ncbi:hypothetical protein L1887_53337 [Cichorium endivia]|nr:hypothetical protein L1887_53337 [Cichorium endivia]